MRRVATDEDIRGVLELPRPSCRSYARAMQLKWFHDKYKNTDCKARVSGTWSFLRGVAESGEGGWEEVIFSNPDPYDKEMGEPVYSQR